jgi:hypothetical protein
MITSHRSVIGIRTTLHDQVRTFEEAMEDSTDAVTSEFAGKMDPPCDGPPDFHNCDNIRVENRS